MISTGRTGRLVRTIITVFHVAYCFQRLKRNTDDADVYHGGPVGVQIMARKFEEEKVWAIAKIVSAALRRGHEST
jgi:hypothetical protein